jgi:uncharacterized OB-fold protein
MTDIVKGWRHNDQRYNLIGTKCKTCGETFFPKRVVCPNCRSHGEIEDLQFKGTGEIYTFSVIYAPPDDFKINAPYAVGIIKLDEGAKVTAQIVDCDVDNLNIGDKVEVVFRKITEEGKSGVISYGYKFKLRK